MTSFTTIVANDLEEIHMIAGDAKSFVYMVYDNETQTAVDLSGATCSVSIFKYGDPNNLLVSLPGVVTGSAVPGEFIASFSGSGLSGVYQQQPKIIDYLGNVHIPSQGKIIIFPSPSS